MATVRKHFDRHVESFSFACLFDQIRPRYRCRCLFVQQQQRFNIAHASSCPLPAILLIQAVTSAWTDPAEVNLLKQSLSYTPLFEETEAINPAYRVTITCQVSFLTLLAKIQNETMHQASKRR